MRAVVAIMTTAMLLGACTATPPPSADPSSDPSATPSGAESSGDAADVVFTGGTVLTLDGADTRGEAIAVTGNLITAVGTAGDIDAFVGDTTQVIDLAGRTVMPGFVDPHTHLFNDRATWGLDFAGMQELALAAGITTFGNMFSDEGFLGEVSDFAASGELKLRTSLYLTWTNNCGEIQDKWWEGLEPNTDPDARLRIQGLKAFADGGSCGRLAASQDIVPGYGPGDLFLTDEQLDELYADGARTGLPVAVHAQGDVAIRQVLEAMIRNDPDGENPRRNRIEHNSMVTPDLYELYGQANPVATIFGMHPACEGPQWTTFYQENGEDWRAQIDANPDLHWSWHGDDPSIPPIDPLIEMDSMVTRQEVLDDGTVCEPPTWLADNALTVDEVLRLMTIGGAYALWRDGEVGSLVPGKFADLIVLDGDPTAPEGRIRDIAVQSTWIDGEPVWCRDGAETSFCPGGPPAPVAAGTFAVTASQSIAGSPPEAALDGDLTRGWVSGDSSPQWIEFDLGEPTEVTAIRLHVDQDPGGHTIHVITGGDHPEPGQELATLDGPTEINDVLEVTGPWTIRYLRISTPDSPSWVAWYEVEIDVA